MLRPLWPLCTSRDGLGPGGTFVTPVGTLTNVLLTSICLSLSIPIDVTLQFRFEPLFLLDRFFAVNQFMSINFPIGSLWARVLETMI